MNNKINIIENKINENLTFNETVLITYDACYPMIDGSDTVSRKFSTAIKEFHKRKIDYLRQSIFPSALRNFDQVQLSGSIFIPYDFYSRFTLNYISINFLSFHMDSVLIKSKTQSFYMKESITFNKSNGEIMRLEDFFFKNSRYKEIFLNNIAQQIAIRVASGCDDYDENWHLKMLEYFNIRNFYLTYRGFCIFYEPHTIAKGTLGYVSFEITYDLFDNIIDFDNLKFYINKPYF